MPVNPELVAAFTVPLAFMGSFIALVYYATKRRLSKGAPGNDIENRLARLEVAIDDMTTELQRVTEGQQFVTKLLSEKALEASHGTR